MPEYFEIASHGGIKWSAASEDAGPYYITHRWMIFASFGSYSSKIQAVKRAGSEEQKEAFLVSRAAFCACKLMLDPETHTAGELRRVVKLAAAASRLEWKRWAKVVKSAEGINGYHAAVMERMVRNMSK